MRLFSKMRVVVLLPCLVIGLAGWSQGYEAEQLVLDWEKLTQLKQLLNDMYKSYQIVEKGYTTIRDISRGSFDLHKAFLDGLLLVSPAVKDYFKVAEIIQYQSLLVREYKQAWGRFQSDGHFTPAEIGYMGTVYGHLFDESVSTLDALITVLTDGQLRASDDERLGQIDVLHEDMLRRLGFLRQFNNQAALLSLFRAVDEEDADHVKRLYGIH